MAKYLLIAAVLISLATAGIGFVNHGTLVETKETLAQTQTTLKGTQGKLTASEADLKTTKATLETSAADKEKIASELNAANSELATTKTSLDTATKDAADKDAKIASLQEQLDKIAQTPANGQGTTTPQQIVDGLNQQITELQASLESSKEQITSLNAKVAVFQKQNQERQTGLLKKGLEGRVLAVNPAWNFVVLSIGDKQGVANNAELLIKRGGQFLGKVRVTSVEPSTSIADIVANSLPTGVSVQPGDSVIFTGEE